MLGLELQIGLKLGLGLGLGSVWPRVEVQNVVSVVVDCGAIVTEHVPYNHCCRFVYNYTCICTAF